MSLRSGVALIGTMLAGCAGHPRTTSVAILPAPVSAAAPAPAPAPAPPAPTPINAGLSPAATLWHLRAGLNVAALACRGPTEAVLAAGYNALLASHATALAAAQASYQAEYANAGGDWRDRYDDDQTRLYNFWSQAHGRAGLCAAASDALAGLDGTDDAALAASAVDRLAALDHALQPPRLEVDARVFTGPSVVMVAMK